MRRGLRGVSDSIFREVPGTALAVFRILYSLILLGEVLQLIAFEALVFDIVPGLRHHEMQAGWMLHAWAVVSLMLVLGAFTRPAAIMSYILTLATISTFDEHGYHYDYVMIGTNLLLIFAPVSRRLSVDALLRRLRYSTPVNPEPVDTRVSYAWHLLFVFAGVGLVYFDSIFYKWASPMWTRGLGVWLPASLPHNTWLPPEWLSPLLDAELLVRGLGYLVLTFETAFIVLMWVPKARLALAVIGVGLHAGILVAFPIPWFGLGENTFYVLMLPVAWFGWAAARVRRREPGCTVRYVPGNRSSWRAKVALERLDVFGRLSFVAVDSQAATLRCVDGNKKHQGASAWWRIFRSMLWAAPLAVPCWLVSLVRPKAWSGPPAGRDQAGDDWTSPVPPAPIVTLSPGFRRSCLVAAFVVTFAVQMVHIVLLGPLAGRGNTGFVAELRNDWGASARWLITHTSDLAGLQGHGVFMDSHFDGYEHVVAVVHKQQDGEEVWLPIVDQQGQASAYGTGRQFVYWSYRKLGPHARRGAMSDGLMKLTAFWLTSNELGVRDARFLVKVKKIRAPFHWEAGLLEESIANPWLDAGEVAWKNGRFQASLVDIERM